MAILGKKAVSTIHPKYWPYSEINYNNVGSYEWTTLNHTGLVGFYSQLIGTFGAYNTTSGKSADTYYTYVDITGSHGAMGTILFPMIATTATGYYTIKLTTDGVVEEFKTISASLNSNYRQWLGFAHEAADNADAKHGYEGYRFQKEQTGIDSFNGKGTIISTQECIAYGYPVHTFDTSLKVEVKCSVGPSQTHNYKHYGTVLYTSSPN